MMPGQRIAVVGAGVFGSWIALLAARAGFETVLIDRYGPANELSSSAGPSRIIRRAYGADEIYTLFAERSRLLWNAFFADENRPHCFRRTGVLWLARETEASIHSAREIFGRHGLAHEFLDSRSIRALCPEMDVPDETVALFEPDCGALLAEESVRAVADSAIRNGARFVSGRVKPPETMGTMRSVDTGNGEHVKADLFVFACGSWLPGLFPEVLGAAIFPTRQEVFEVLPRKPIVYRNQVVKEFDLDAALARRPGLLLVDEYAHTNVPGSRHPKRWQDIDELLAAGIDVWTTLNIQHLESLNDVVQKITRVRVRETVPDTVFDKADEIVLVDFPPDELLKRLAEGKVYVQDTAARAVESFFKQQNLRSAGWSPCARAPGPAPRAPCRRCPRAPWTCPRSRAARPCASRSCAPRRARTAGPPSRPRRGACRPRSSAAWRKGRFRARRW